MPVIFHSIYVKKFIQTIKTSLFLFEIWVYIKIESRGYIRVPEYYAYRFVVALTFNATCGKGMPKPVKHNLWHVKTFEQTSKSFTVGAWLFGL